MGSFTLKSQRLERFPLGRAGYDCWKPNIRSRKLLGLRYRAKLPIPHIAFNFRQHYAALVVSGHQLPSVIPDMKLSNPRFFAILTLVLPTIVNDALADVNAETMKSFLWNHFLFRSNGDVFSQKYLSIPMIGCESSTFYQYHGFIWDWATLELSDADKLNGIKWNGELTTKISAFRKWRESSSNCAMGGQPGCWEKWVNMPHDMNFKWTLRDLNGTLRAMRVDHPNWEFTQGVPIGEHVPTEKDVTRILSGPICEWDK